LLTSVRSLTLESSPTAALLKTADKTYSLRQKNTSNALIILSSAEPPSSSSTEIGDAVGGLNAIATVHDTIELVAETENAKAPAATARGKWHEKFGKSR
jgi:sister chromatid cohesion protein DCC1